MNRWAVSRVETFLVKMTNLWALFGARGAGPCGEDVMGSMTSRSFGQCGKLPLMRRAGSRIGSGMNSGALSLAHFTDIHFRKECATEKERQKN
ncbi:hypothetical protein NDU88_003291 [Pleurodeles waltl]|uniref:Secreted protein n=1 Tax=Pleurodeles waltl TaxID=8319 RepID=A0AAV7UDL7_PLEWA|nr:hypothetical protein NDU88_003291 [Pleurodeles waltl]